MNDIVPTPYVRTWEAVDRLPPDLPGPSHIVYTYMLGVCCPYGESTSTSSFLFLSFFPLVCILLSFRIRLSSSGRMSSGGA